MSIKEIVCFCKSNLDGSFSSRFVESTNLKRFFGCIEFQIIIPSNKSPCCFDRELPFLFYQQHHLQLNGGLRASI